MKSVLVMFVALALGAAMVVGSFFFQAEDGIRDTSVTGVQTCALPISQHRHRRRRGDSLQQPPQWRHGHRRRSEERRVGKECRARWVAYNEKKKMATETGIIMLV